MSDEPEDGSAWLSSQLPPTKPAPAQPTPDAAVPAAPTPPAGSAAAPPASGGGFTWGLRAPSSAAEPAPSPARPEAVAPPAPASPPAPAPGTAALPPIIVEPVPVPVHIPAPVAEVVPPVIPTRTPPTLVLPPVQEPTAPLNWSEFAATQQVAGPPAASNQAAADHPALDHAAVDQPTEAYTVQPWQPAAVAPPGAPPENPGQLGETDETEGVDEPGDGTSAIDSLFGDHKFQEYQEVGVLATMQVPPSSVEEPVVREPRAPLPTTQKVLMGVAGGLIAVLILIGLFFLGQHLGSAQAVAPAPKRTPGASATPTPAGTGGPVAPGVQQWDALQGGECIQPFTSAWAQTFTVVACSADHDAEMVFKGKLPDSASVAYPSTADFKQLITPLCSAPTAINYTTAAAVTDLQVSFSYPPNTAAWIAGDRTYYCFVDRVSGGNLAGDLAVAKAPAAG